MKSKYKDNGGRYRTLSLFKEKIQASTKDRYEPCFTLTPEDKGELPSMHRLFVESEDPTEYKFALEVLGSWSHWQMLKQCTWFQPYYETWRAELDSRIRSKGIKVLTGIAEGKSPAAATAAKWLAEGGWKEHKKESKRGRPSKDEVNAAAKQIAEEQTEIDTDAERIGAVVGSKRVN